MDRQIIEVEGAKRVREIFYAGKASTFMDVYITIGDEERKRTRMIIKPDGALHVIGEVNGGISIDDLRIFINKHYQRRE